MFLSKSFNKVQLRWSVLEKEGYAIHYALHKWDHLLRDVPFVLETDHHKLTRIYSSGSAKVLRWHLHLQSYNCEIRHIKGEQNFVADKLSRLCPVSDDNEYIGAFEEFLVTDSTADQPPTGISTEVLAAPLHEIDSLTDEVHNEIALVHNEIVGHHGVERTLRKLFRKDKQWKYMREHVKFFIRNCPYCQKISQIKVQISTAPFVASSREPMSRISFDSIGVLTEDVDWKYDHVMVVIDNFTRWVELYPTRGATAAEAARVLIDHTGRYGVASEWLSDLGSQFKNEVIAVLTDTFGTAHKFTLASSKEENAIVERANKEVMRHLRALLFVAGNFQHWSKYIPFVARIMNSSVHEATGVTPAQLLMPGVNLDRQLIDISTESTGTEPMPLPTWVEEMHDIQLKLIHAAQVRIGQHEADHCDENDLPPVTVFQPNSYVLLQYPEGAFGPRPPNKFNTQLRGPFKVLGSVGAHYDILNLVTNKVERVHVSRLRPFKRTRQSTDPIEVAQKDYQEFIVESVLAHAGDPKLKSQMDFLVKWQGYGNDENLWLPWKELRNNPKLHEYLFSVGMMKIIPKEFRDQYEERAR